MTETYQKFNSSDKEKIWHQELSAILSIDAWNRYYQLVTGITLDNRIKWLQYQILRHLLKTNNIISHFTDTTRSCTFCKESNSTETISHHCHDCATVSKIWNSLKNYITEHETEHFLTKINILFGVKSEGSMSLKNLLILISKQYFWKCRIKKKLPSFIGLKHALKDYLENLKMAFTIKINLKYLPKNLSVYTYTLFVTLAVTKQMENPTMVSKLKHFPAASAVGNLHPVPKASNHNPNTPTPKSHLLPTNTDPTTKTSSTTTPATKTPCTIAPVTNANTSCALEEPKNSQKANSSKSTTGRTECWACKAWGVAHPDDHGAPNQLVGLQSQTPTKPQTMGRTPQPKPRYYQNLLLLTRDQY